MSASNPVWKMVDEVPGPTQAEILKGLLTAQGIEVSLSEEGVGRALGLATGPMATVQILVPESRFDEAREILERYYSGDLMETDPDGEDASAGDPP